MTYKSSYTCQSPSKTRQINPKRPTPNLNRARLYPKRGNRFAEGPTALLLGNEVHGVAVPVMDACDGVIEIPTFGRKNSLNVASACAVVVFEALRQLGAL